MTWQCAGDTSSGAKISSYRRAKCSVAPLIPYLANTQHCGIIGSKLIDVTTTSAHGALTYAGFESRAGSPKYAQKDVSLWTPQHGFERSSQSAIAPTRSPELT